MTRKKVLITLSIILVCSATLFTACKHVGQNRGELCLDYVTEVLDLTAEQEQQLNEIRDEIMAKVDAVHDGHDAMHDTLRSQLTSESVDKAVLKDLVANHRQQVDGIITLAIDRLSDFHSTLTPEQKEKLITKLEKLEKHHKSRWHH
ncbi:MAG: periplasmic heavy metal sensor [Desulfobulbaceae bacterium]|nr:MAG: periplasmic heavy metal sensor [Desulfobulbaceae bacterium]